jgi:HAD superfamily hydrolase (TIGR01509 family)
MANRQQAMVKKARIRSSGNSGIRCVIYDCDGVLFDSLDANGRLYNDLCAAMGRPPVKAEEMKYIHSHTVFESIHYLFPESRETEERALEILKQLDVRNYVVYLKMEPHLIETLQTLKGRGIFRAINTNRTTSVPALMDRFNLRPHFDMVVTALDVKHSKPHPESVEKILHTLGVSKEETLFVGDSEVDRETAQASGVRFAAYKNPEIAKEIFLEDHLDLLDYLS